MAPVKSHTPLKLRSLKQRRSRWSYIRHLAKSGVEQEWHHQTYRVGGQRSMRVGVHDVAIDHDRWSWLALEHESSED